MLKCGCSALATVLFLLAGGAGRAESISPEGLWEPENRESRYEIFYCGNGTELCGLVSWIDPDVQNEENSELLNTYIFSEIPARGRGKWRGMINIQGHTIRGTVKQMTADRLSVKACIFLLCEEVMLMRVDASGQR